MRGFRLSKDRRKALVKVLTAASSYTMTPEEKRSRAISFVYGNLSLLKEYANATPEELAALRKRCEEVYDKKQASLNRSPNET